MSQPRLLDLFAGAGGCSVGYDQAGFDVVGVDTIAHIDYPYPFACGDAITTLRRLVDGGTIGFKNWFGAGGFERWFTLNDFDTIHASPPCPRYSAATPAANRHKHPDLIGPIRELLQASGLPYVIENVPGAPLDTPVLLCGSMFGLGVRRHRLFETNVPMLQPECDHWSQPHVWGVYGDHGDANPVTRPDGTSRGNKARDAAHAREVMGIDWMTEWDDLADAIPPAYTEYIGARLLEHINERAA